MKTQWNLNPLMSSLKCRYFPSNFQAETIICWKVLVDVITQVVKVGIVASFYHNLKPTEINHPLPSIYLLTHPSPRQPSSLFPRISIFQSRCLLLPSDVKNTVSWLHSWKGEGKHHLQSFQFILILKILQENVRLSCHRCRAAGLNQDGCMRPLSQREQINQPAVLASMSHFTVGWSWESPRSQDRVSESQQCPLLVKCLLWIQWALLAFRECN